jgi:hypothetical protein
MEGFGCSCLIRLLLQGSAENLTIEGGMDLLSPGAVSVFRLPHGHLAFDLVLTAPISTAPISCIVTVSKGTRVSGPGSNEVEQKNDHIIAHRRIVAEREILRNPR